MLSKVEDAARPPRPKKSVFTNVLKQMNAKMRKDLYRLEMKHLYKTMVVGVDLVNKANITTLGLCSTSRDTQTQCYSEIVNIQNPSRVDHQT